MATGTMAGMGPITVEDYVRQHGDANPQDLLKLLMQRERIPMSPDGTFAPRTLEDVYRIGQFYAQCDMVPDSFKGKPANCAVAVEYAQQLGVPPLFFMQQSYVVKGKPAISASLMIALLNKSKRLSAPLSYEQGGEGKDRWWTATGTDAATGKPVSFRVTWAMVEAEGWHLDKGNNGSKSKWMTLPDLMGRYRSASYLIRTHYPDVLMGLTEVDELRDQARAEESERAADVRQSSRPRDLAGLAGTSATVRETFDTAFETKTATVETNSKGTETATLSPGEIPPLDAYAADLEDAKTVKAAGIVYDKWFGPESREAWTPDQCVTGLTLYESRKAAIRKAEAAAKVAGDAKE